MLEHSVILSPPELWLNSIVLLKVVLKVVSEMAINKAFNNEKETDRHNTEHIGLREKLQGKSMCHRVQFLVPSKCVRGLEGTVTGRGLAHPKSQLD